MIASAAPVHVNVPPVSETFSTNCWLVPPSEPVPMESVIMIPGTVLLGAVGAFA